MPAAKGLFITGNNTDVGKTYVAALIAQSLVKAGIRVGVYKPAASGCIVENGVRISEDAQTLWRAAGQPGELERVCPQMFLAPLAPHLAARSEGREVDPQLLRSGLKYWLDRSDLVIVEGAGGLMSPMTDDEYVADLALDFGFPLVVVAQNALGVINQTLQTLVVAETFRDGLQVAGIVLNDNAPNSNDSSTASNPAELRARCIPPVLDHVAFGGQLTQPVDWLSLARRSN